RDRARSKWRHCERQRGAGSAINLCHQRSATDIENGEDDFHRTRRRVRNHNLASISATDNELRQQDVLCNFKEVALWGYSETVASGARPRHICVVTSNSSFVD